MAKAFSVASWNVEHFGEDADRAGRVAAYLAAQNADIVAVYEVEGSRIFRPLMEHMPGHQFHVTEGPQIQEILVGVKRGLSAFVTQKLEFKSGQTTLRPGVLVTVRVDGEYYPLLFLHLKSQSDPKGFGLRDDMIARALSFRTKLNETSSGRANYIFLGDLNTMGLKYPYVDDIAAETEIRRIRGRASRRDMRLLAKSRPHTWWNGPESSYEPANLDHVVAAEHLGFKDFGGSEVDVRGWPGLSTGAEQARWISEYSDHALLYFEVQRV